MEAEIPGGAHDWTRLLPSPWDEDPNVVVVLAPKGSKYSTRETPDHETEFGCMDANGIVLGLQVLKPKLMTYSENRLMFSQMNGRMAKPAYTGPLSKVPQKLLNTADFVQMVFMTEEMHRPYLNLKKALFDVTVITPGSN